MCFSNNKKIIEFNNDIVIHSNNLIVNDSNSDNNSSLTVKLSHSEIVGCVKSGHSKSGKTYPSKSLLKKVKFYILFVIGPTANQNDHIEKNNEHADAILVEGVKDLPAPDQLPKNNFKKLMILDDVRAKSKFLMSFFVVDIGIAISFISTKNHLH